MQRQTQTNRLVYTNNKTNQGGCVQLHIPLRIETQTSSSVRVLLTACFLLEVLR